MTEQFQLLINQIRIMAKLTDVQPDPVLYQIQGDVWQRMSMRLKLLTAFLQNVNEVLKVDKSTTVPTKTGIKKKE